jgi:hypothetical protein
VVALVLIIIAIICALPGVGRANAATTAVLPTWCLPIAIGICGEGGFSATCPAPLRGVAWLGAGPAAMLASALLTNPPGAATLIACGCENLAFFG